MSNNDPNHTPQRTQVGEDSRVLLATYPMASTTPVTHLSRHLSTLTRVEQIPVYCNPTAIPSLHQTQAHNRVQHIPYSHAFAQLSAPVIPSNPPDRAFWDASQQQAARVLSPYMQLNYEYRPSPHPRGPVLQYGQYFAPPPSNPYQAPQPPQPPIPPYYGPSTARPFAQALLPSADQSVSSVPFPRPVKKEGPTDSKTFFNDFLAKTMQMTHQKSLESPDNVTTSVLPPRRSDLQTNRPAEAHQIPSFTDPRSLLIPSNTSPQKRKAGDHLQSPTVKRVHSNSPEHGQAKCITIPSMKSAPTPKRLQPYVAVPPVPAEWRTPTVRTMVTDMSSDRAPSVTPLIKNAWSPGSSLDVDGDKEWKGSPQQTESLPPSTIRRTGERDDRNPLEKFISFMEEIFEAEDTVPIEGPSDPQDQTHTQHPNSPFRFFSLLNRDWGHPRLHPHVMRKLVKTLEQITKRRRSKKASQLATIDAHLLGRLLKLLQRSVKAGEDLSVFVGPMVPRGDATGAGGGKTKGAPAKKSKKAKGKEQNQNQNQERERSRSKTPMIIDEEESESAISVDWDKLEFVLHIALESVLAADGCIALLGVDDLSKQLYSEELISSCLGAIKNQLDRVMYPFLEANNDAHGSQITRALFRVATETDPFAQSLRGVIAEIFHALVSVLPRVDRLVGRSDLAMSDTITIQSVYIAIGPFFVVEPVTEGRGSTKSKELVLSALGGATSLKGLRLSALSLIRSIFANNGDQRQWIIEEILSSLIKLPDFKQKGSQFRLRNGQCIHTVSALLLQLIQTSPHRLREEAFRITNRQTQIQRADNSILEDDSRRAPLEPAIDEELKLYARGLDAAQKAAGMVVVFLTQRAGKGKATKSSNEAEYRIILDTLISDVLTVLYLPEWPGAALLLGIATRLFVSSLDDVKTNSNIDNNATRSMALDHLGTIAAKMRTASLHEAGNDSLSMMPMSLEEASANCKLEHVEIIICAQQEVSTNLSHKAAEDQAYSSAQDLFGATWGHDLYQAISTCNSAIIGMQGRGEVTDKMLIIRDRLVLAMREIWKQPTTDVFKVVSESDTARIDNIALRLGSLTAFNRGFDAILSIVLGSLDAAAVFMRTKALRSLGQVLASDPTVLKKLNVRKAIEDHLLDNSSAVRDAAVELIGKYVVQRPELAGDYYERIVDRILDTGLGVRKRIIKLLKVFYGNSASIERRADISLRLVHRMLDEDDGVKDLAMKTLEELWFPPDDMLKHADDKIKVVASLPVILSVVGNRERQTNVQEFLHRIVADKMEREATALVEQYARICDALIDTLVDGQELPGFSLLNCIKTVHLFVAAKPSIMSSNKAATLLPYLKHATNTDEQLISDHLLKIFRLSIPCMSKTAVKFGQDLQATLQVMVVKPSSIGGLQTMQEAIACLCAVVNNQTHEHGRLVGLLKSCLGRLKDTLSKHLQQPDNAMVLRQMQLLICMVGLLGEHCDFDQVRLDRQDLVSEVDQITKESVSLHIYRTFLQLFDAVHDNSIRHRVLQCLGFLFRAYPTLMTEEATSGLMDGIFASNDVDMQGRLLKIIQDFLSTTSAKQTELEKAAPIAKPPTVTVNMDEFIGNAQGFAESGVSSAVVQRYLPQILEASLGGNATVQNAAVDILGFTIRQGLAHPLQCLPTIIALETSDNAQLSSRANGLHTVLHSKHTSLIHARYLDCAQAAFKYQERITRDETRGVRYEPECIAVLHKWYSLVKEKRSTRTDFLRAITKCFDIDSTKLAATEDDVNFVRFMAENLSAFDYRTQEEVLIVIRQITNVLSVAGMQLLEILSPSNLMAQLTDMRSQPPGRLGTSLPSTFEPFAMAHASTILGMILLLKSHLKALYGLSEEKCSKWVPNKKSAIGDKPAVKKNHPALRWDALPFAARRILTLEDVTSQQETFLRLWEAEPMIAEVEEEPGGEP